MLIMRSNDGCLWAHFFRTDFGMSHVFAGRQEFGQRSVGDQVKSAFEDRIRITVHQSMFGGDSSMFPDFDDYDSDYWYMLEKEKFEEYLDFLGCTDPDERDDFMWDMREEMESVEFLAWQRTRAERERLADLFDAQTAHSSRHERKRLSRSRKDRC